MKWLIKLIGAILANGLALLLAAYFISDFKLTSDYKEVAVIALILTALNFILKPVLKLILGPIIILTLGLGLILVNAIVLYILDILTKNLTIETTPALVFASVIVGVTNFIFHLFIK
jgi:putative membrane protein